MEIVTKVKEKFKRIGIFAVECSSIDHETGSLKKGLQFCINSNCDVVIYADKDWSEDEFYCFCQATLSEHFENPEEQSSYTATLIMQNCYLAVEKHNPLRDEDMLCRKYLNLDVLVYIEVEEEVSETLTITAMKHAGLTEESVWTAAYHNTENRTFLEIPENKRPVPNTLSFESSYCCGSSGILIKNLLRNFCTERGVGYCFIIPESQMYTQVTAPVCLGNDQFINPKIQARKLLRDLKRTELSEEAVSVFGDKPLDPVIYIYDKLFDHVEIIAK